jgi:hypothetical protein
MQRHFMVQKRMDRGRAGAHFVQIAGLDHGQRPGAGEMDQEQVILHQIVQKGGARQAAVAHALDKGVAGIGVPVGGRLSPLREGVTVAHFAPRSTARSLTGRTSSISPAS